jgi:hypothetical protein
MDFDVRTRRHTDDLEPFRDQFRAMGADAIDALDGVFAALVHDRADEREGQGEYLYALPRERRPASDTGDEASLLDRGSLMSRRLQQSPAPATRQPSRLAVAAAVRPFRDIFDGETRLLAEDRKLDFIGAPYPEVWSKTTDTAPGAADWQGDRLTTWADPADGAFGFDNDVHGTVTGRHRFSGAAIYGWFVPPPTVGFAQVRPLVDYAWQWSDMSFRSVEHTSASFGLLVWSWDAAGADLVLEQDYRYSAWDDWCAADYFDAHNSPSWVTGGGGPGWDDGYAFRPNESPYFATRPGRIYKTAVWCFGQCFSYSPENRPGGATARLNATVPLIVIGFQ